MYGANSFELINNLYARDHRRVYFTDRVLDGADAPLVPSSRQGIGSDGSDHLCIGKTICHDWLTWIASLL